jgi:cell wall-associated NlpC family hydrolase
VHTVRSILAVVVAALLASASAMALVPTPQAHADAGCGVLQSGASPAAQRAVLAACQMVGVNYAWGGGHNALPGPAQGHVDIGDPIRSANDPTYWGFDCSGLVRWAWFEATGVDVLGRGTAHQMHDTLGADPQNQTFSAAQGDGPLLPGDLVYYGTIRAIGHTAIYIGGGRMVEAHQSGELVKVSDWRSDSYIGAVRLSTNQADPPFRYPGDGAAFKTWGRGNFRTGPHTTDSVKYTADGGSVLVRVLCQADGDQATVSGITNHVWSYLPEYEVWVSNIFIEGPAVLPNVPPCSNYLAIGGTFTTPGGSDKAFSTWGTSVHAHGDPNTTSGVVFSFPGPTPVQVGCQEHAQTVTAEGITNDAWSYLPEYGGWMTNIYIQGPAWLAGVPDCGGGSGGGGGAATCADNTAPSATDARSPRSTTLFGRLIELRYSDASQCAWGRISNGNVADIIWVDRSSDGGATWEPQLGYTTIGSGRDQHTNQFRDAGVVTRACGMAGDRPDIACTDWF